MTLPTSVVYQSQARNSFFFSSPSSKRVKGKIRPRIKNYLWAEILRKLFWKKKLAGCWSLSFSQAQQFTWFVSLQMWEIFLWWLPQQKQKRQQHLTTATTLKTTTELGSFSFEKMPSKNRFLFYFEVHSWTKAHWHNLRPWSARSINRLAMNTKKNYVCTCIFDDSR